MTRRRPENLAFLGPRHFQAETQAKLALTAALAALKAAPAGGSPVPLPLSMQLPGDPTALLGQGSQLLAPPAPLALPAPAAGLPLGLDAPGISPPPAMPSTALAAPSAPLAAPMRRPLATPTMGMRSGGALRMSTGGGLAAPAVSPSSLPPIGVDPTSIPGSAPIAPGPRMKEDTELLPGVIPASKLVPLMANMLMQQKASGAAVADPNRALSAAGLGPPPAAATPPPADQGGSEVDYILSAMAAPQPPAQFLSWVTSADPRTLPPTAAQIVTAFQRNPGLAPVIFQAAQDVARDAPDELPESVRALLGG